MTVAPVRYRVNAIAGETVQPTFWDVISVVNIIIHRCMGNRCTQLSQFAK